MSDNRQDETMGNQQERLLGWFAGILDGEGTISIQMYLMPNKCLRAIPIIGIVNTHKPALELCMKIIKDVLKVKSFHQCRFLKKKGYTPCYQIRIDGYPSVKTLLEGIKNYLVIKKDKAEIVLQFINDRDENRLYRDKLGRIHRMGYTKKQVDLIMKTRVTKRGQAKSSETIRRAVNIIDR